MSAPAGKPFFCFAFNRWQANPCGCKGCARRVVNREARVTAKVVPVSPRSTEPE